MESSEDKSHRVLVLPRPEQELSMESSEDKSHRVLVLPRPEQELGMESSEDKSPRRQNLVAEAVWSGSTAQEGSGEEKPRRSLSRRGCKGRARGSEGERASLGRGGGQSSELGVREQLQDGEKPHKSSELGVREQLQDGGKPHKCPECGKSFKRSSCLIVHQKNHTRQEVRSEGERASLGRGGGSELRAGDP
ncbi:zinc finger protein with KRAB and SCAN domains 1-like [Haemorhous mexicanus]|uniref:zinc finger protein with KRAB and SCAN domains 1-like n=1 Tax=Haemorhous mexicanus TaxID=30427 RepID=UPI0028BD4423|nr:zinc finger protein with KRAB and SCAN domains 1-like [Haemorhous mexicanus]